MVHTGKKNRSVSEQTNVTAKHHIPTRGAARAHVRDIGQAKLDSAYSTKCGLFRFLSLWEPSSVGNAAPKSLTSKQTDPERERETEI